MSHDSPVVLKSPEKASEGCGCACIILALAIAFNMQAIIALAQAYLETLK